MANARLFPFTVINPGGKGLNKQMSGTLLDPQWSTKSMNTVFDDSNRLASRLGWSSVTGTPIGGTPALSQIFEYKPLAPNPNIIIFAGNNKLYQGLSVPADITGLLTITASNWQFANFNGNLYGLQAAHSFIQWTGTGNATAVTITSGSAPTGNNLFAAWSRLFATNSDKQTIQYSALLDATKWASVDGGGSINMLSVWPSPDEIVAIHPFNNFLVIFGKNNIIIYTDPTGTIHGINPNNIVIYDQIQGIGCVARDSIRSVAGQDLVFLSNTGVTSLQRLLVQRSSPLRDISANIRSYVKSALDAEDVTKIRSTYNPRYGIYLLVFPTSGTILCFDTKVVLQDGTWRVTEWSGMTPTSLYTLEDGTTTYQGALGAAYNYAGSTDNGTSITMSYLSGWLDFGPDVNNYLKTLKTISAIISVTGTVSVNFQWAFDFSSAINSVTKSTAFQATSLYYADQANSPTQYGVALYGASTILNEYTVSAYGSGQFFQLGLSATVTNGQVSLQQIQAFAKVGRLF
jgi:hypothetical protein